MDILFTEYKKHKKLLTLSVFKTKERFGKFEIKNNKIKNFREKELRECEWVNGGYMIANKKIFSYLSEDSGPFESEVIERLMKTNDIVAYKYDGFWQCMDYRDEQRQLNKLIKNGKVMVNGKTTIANKEAYFQDDLMAIGIKIDY